MQLQFKKFLSCTFFFASLIVLAKQYWMSEIICLSQLKNLEWVHWLLNSPNFLCFTFTHTHSLFLHKHTQLNRKGRAQSRVIIELCGFIFIFFYSSLSTSGKRSHIKRWRVSEGFGDAILWARHRWLRLVEVRGAARGYYSYRGRRNHDKEPIRRHKSPGAVGRVRDDLAGEGICHRCECCRDVQVEEGI